MGGNVAEKDSIASDREEMMATTDSTVASVASANSVAEQRPGRRCAAARLVASAPCHQQSKISVLNFIFLTSANQPHDNTDCTRRPDTGTLYNTPSTRMTEAVEHCDPEIAHECSPPCLRRLHVWSHASARYLYIYNGLCRARDMRAIRGDAVASGIRNGEQRLI